MAGDGKDGEAMRLAERRVLDRYWRSNVKTMVVLLLLWALVSFGCGILFADHLNQWTLLDTGYSLGFWFAQQGSILGFVIIIFSYALMMNRTDARHHRELESVRHGESNNIGL